MAKKPKPPPQPHVDTHSIEDTLNHFHAENMKGNQAAEDAFKHFEITNPAATQGKYAKPHEAVLKKGEALHGHGQTVEQAAGDVGKLKGMSQPHEAELKALDNAGRDAHEAFDVAHQGLRDNHSALKETEEVLKKQINESKVLNDAQKAAKLQELEQHVAGRTGQFTAAEKALDLKRTSIAEQSGVASLNNAGKQVEKTAEKEAGVIGKTFSRFGYTRLKEGVGHNLSKEGGMKGNLKVGAGALFVGHGALNAFKDIGSMMSSEPGRDKEGNELPKPGLLKLGVDAAEVAGGLWLASHGKTR